MQGAALTAALVSYQRQGALLQSVDMLKFCILISGTLSRLEAHRSAYAQPIPCPSLHLIGQASLTSAERLFAICRAQGRTVPCPSCGMTCCTWPAS